MTIEGLNHILFIMDGNGRWAKKKLLPRSAGHLAGVKRIREIVDECFLTYGVPYVSLFCFSSENWNRPQKEIDTLFKLLKDFFTDNLEKFLKDGTRIRVVGDLDNPRIPKDILETINDAQEKTKHLENYNFTVLFNYGGRQDVVHATKTIAKLCMEGKINPDDVDVDTFKDYLWTKNLPDVDLMVRTSGELRVSNCYLYQIAYAEMEFPKTYWPDFSKKDLAMSLDEFQKRNRRFGAIKE